MWSPLKSPTPFYAFSSLVPLSKGNHNRVLLYFLPFVPLIFSLVSSTRKAILKNFEDNHPIASHSQKNKMTPSIIVVCMAPLLLHPLLAGECELKDELDVNGDNAA